MPENLECKLTKVQAGVQTRRSKDGAVKRTRYIDANVRIPHTHELEDALAALHGGAVLVSILESQTELGLGDEGHE